MQLPSAIIWDGLGTLWRPIEPWTVVWARLALDHGMVADAAAMRKRLREGLWRAPPPAFGDLPPRRRRSACDEWWRQRLAEAMAMPVGLLPEGWVAAVRRSMADPARLTLPPGALATTRRAAALGILQYLLQNGDGALTSVPAALGLPIAAGDVVTSEELLAAKPDPLAWRTLCGVADLDPAAVAVVDDTAACRDAARSLGCVVYADATALAAALSVDL
jgi:FMN phosphatase YigB (HAD superfamily)